MTAQVETVYRGYCEDCNIDGPITGDIEGAASWAQGHDDTRHPRARGLEGAVDVAHEILMNSQLRIRLEGATTREVTRDALLAALRHLTPSAVATEVAGEIQ